MNDEMNQEPIDAVELGRGEVTFPSGAVYEISGGSVTVAHDEQPTGGSGHRVTVSRTINMACRAPASLGKTSDMERVHQAMMAALMAGHK